jgi:hypothetical protein
VLPLLADVIVTGLFVKEYCAASGAARLAVKLTLPVKPPSGLTVNTTDGAMLPEATVTLAVAGVSAKSGPPAAVIVTLNAPFDPENVLSPV